MAALESARFEKEEGRARSLCGGVNARNVSSRIEEPFEKTCSWDFVVVFEITKLFFYSSLKKKEETG